MLSFIKKIISLINLKLLTIAFMAHVFVGVIPKISLPFFGLKRYSSLLFSIVLLLTLKIRSRVYALCDFFYSEVNIFTFPHQYKWSQCHYLAIFIHMPLLSHMLTYTVMKTQKGSAKNIILNKDTYL